MSKMAKSPFRDLCFAIQKHFFSTSAQPKSTNRVSSVVKLSGSSSESTISIAKEIWLERNTKLVSDFLRSHGFSDAQIAELTRRRPEILRSTVSTMLKPKVEFLVENGFPGPLLPKVILKNPSIFSRGLHNHLKPSMELLKKFLGTNEKVKAVVMRCCWILTHNLKKTMLPNIQLMIADGVPPDGISRMILWQPRAILQNVERMASCINKVKDLGLNPVNRMFVHALRAMLSMSEATWGKKLQVFKSLGWTEEEVINAFKHQPVVLNISEKKIRSSTDFLVNTLKLTPDAIISNPVLFNFSLNSRLYPRHSVVSVLKSRKLLKQDPNIISVLMHGENDFYSKYVLKYSDIVPELAQIYSDSKLMSKPQNT